MRTSQIEVMSRYLTLIAPSRKEIPRARAYNSITKIGTRTQVQLGETPLIKAKIITTAKLMNKLIIAVSVAETTTIYLGKQISFQSNCNENEIDRRINIAWRKYWSQKEILKGTYSLQM